MLSAVMLSAIMLSVVAPQHNINIVQSSVVCIAYVSYVAIKSSSFIQQNDN
jgi:hypothetical protein